MLNSAEHEILNAQKYKIIKKLSNLQAQISLECYFSCSLYPRHLCRGVYSFRLDVCPFVCSFVRVFVRSLLSVTFVEFTSKFLVKVSLSEYISLTTNQKAFIFEPWVPERVSFYTMGFCPRVDAPGWG